MKIRRYVITRKIVNYKIMGCTSDKKIESNDKGLDRKRQDRGGD